ncbi:hypothetical protein RJ640_016336, partial [Escallonia rubra]
FDLVKFVRTVHEAGLYVHLRIGPYVSAEWNYGSVFLIYLHYAATFPVFPEIKTINNNILITIIIEDYVTSPKGLTKEFDAAGLRKFWFPVSRMPRNGEDWPTVDYMLRRSPLRALFMSGYIWLKTNKKKEAKVFERTIIGLDSKSVDGDGGMKAGSCPNRKESFPMSTKKRSLVLMNFCPSDPNISQACKENSDPLISMMSTCHEAAGERCPDFIAVNIYKRSDGGGAAEAVDMANGQLVCGCANIAHCKLPSDVET